MEKNDREFKKGEYIMLSSGEYSDYGVNAVGVATRDFTLSGVYEEYISEHPEQSLHWNLVNYQLIAWLTRSGGPIEEIDTSEINVTYDFRDK